MSRMILGHTLFRHHQLQVRAGDCGVSCQWLEGQASLGHEAEECVTVLHDLVGETAKDWLLG